MYGAAGPGAFDCSGLTYYAFRHAGFGSIPRTSAAQSHFARHISRANMHRGDLMFFYGSGGVYHVGIFAGIDHDPVALQVLIAANLGLAEVSDAIDAYRTLFDKDALRSVESPLGFDPGNAGRPLASAERRRVTVETARRLTPLGVDVLKAEFPVRTEEEPDESVWRAACEELDAASVVPWVILSAGVSGATFHRQTMIACEAGASGVIAGRSIWAEAVSVDEKVRRAFLAGPARERLTRLREVCESTATPFMARRR